MKRDDAREASTLTHSNRRSHLNERGQVTLFIIIALAIVAIAILIFVFYPQLETRFGTSVEDPMSFMQECLEDDFADAVELISLQGGSIKPTNFIMYDDSKIDYLCYSGDYYSGCTMQKPLLQQHIESEILNYLNARVDECFSNLEENYRNKGFSVTLNEGNKDMELLPRKIVATFGHELILKKGESQTYKIFRIVLNNNLYELSSIAMSILNMEAEYGDVEITEYMNFYHDLKVEKFKQTDGSTIYVLTELDTGDKFQFASRSYAFPSGYGLSQYIE